MESIDDYLNQGINFAKWKLPSEKKIHLNSPKELTATNKFIVQPFISLPEPIEIASIASPIKGIKNPGQFSKKEYIDLVQKTRDSLKNGLKKIVVSRVEIHERKRTLSIEKVFNKLCEDYPNAFVFCYHHHQLGTWIGATPEQLIRREKGVYTTMALAGTKSLTDNSPWTEKEKEEHQYVIDDLLTKINSLNGSGIQVGNTNTINTGVVKHLQTKITFACTQSALDVAEHFHPTPAVCGTPTKSALEFILKNEPYNRECYTGYLGINNQETTNLFVNLRSMRVTADKFILYLGGGITAASDPEKEWEETKNKAKTLLSVIQNC